MWSVATSPSIKVASSPSPVAAPSPDSTRAVGGLASWITIITRAQDASIRSELICSLLTVEAKAITGCSGSLSPPSGRSRTRSLRTRPSVAGASSNLRQAAASTMLKRQLSHHLLRCPRTRAITPLGTWLGATVCSLARASRPWIKTCACKAVSSTERRFLPLPVLQ